MVPVGSEFLIGSSDEPAFDIEDDLDSVLADIGGWSYLLRQGRADYHWYDAVIAPENLEAFALGCEVLAEEYGDPSRCWSGAATEYVRAWTITGTDLSGALAEMSRLRRTASEARVPLTIRSDAGWVEQTWWQSAEDRSRTDPSSHPRRS
jgi:hypothetical protein